MMIGSKTSHKKKLDGKLVVQIFYYALDKDKLLEKKSII